jgi:hypothetical protein
MPACDVKRKGLVKVVLSRIKNPSKSPFTKGDFLFPLLRKGEGEIFGPKGIVKINSLR